MQISRLPTGKSLQELTQHLESGHPSLLPLQELSRSERHYQAAVTYAQRRGGQRGGGTTSSKGGTEGQFNQRLQQEASQIQDNTRSLLRTLQTEEADRDEVFDAAYKVQKKEYDERKRAEREEEGEESDEESEEEEEESVDPETLKIASPPAAELAVIFHDVKEALQVKLSVTVEQQKAKYEFIRNLEERIRQAQSEQRLLKEELRRVRKQRESELTSITDTADRLNSELGDLEEHAETERNNLKGFVERRTQELDENHIAQVSNPLLVTSANEIAMVANSLFSDGTFRTRKK